MVGGQLRQFPCCGVLRPAAIPRVAPSLQSRSSRPAVVRVNSFFDKFKSGGGEDKGQSNDEDAARKALQDSFGTQKKNFGQQQSGGGGGSDSGQGGSAGKGGGGGGGFGGSAGDSSRDNKSMWAELWEVLRYSWTVFCNLALFLVFADVLHRSLDWCCSVELLFLVGAPQQALERLASRFFVVAEWVEKNMLGWDIPGDEDVMHQYENIKMYYPRAHAYVFDQYKYDLTPKEKDTLINQYALRHYEREGGRPGDVDPADIAAIRRRVEPLEADRRDYQNAVASGRVEDYWASRKSEYERVTGRKFVRPPGTSPPPPTPVL